MHIPWTASVLGWPQTTTTLKQRLKRQPNHVLRQTRFNPIKIYGAGTYMSLSPSKVLPRAGNNQVWSCTPGQRSRGRARLRYASYVMLAALLLLLLVVVLLFLLLMAMAGWDDGFCKLLLVVVFLLPFSLPFPPPIAPPRPSRSLSPWSM